MPIVFAQPGVAVDWDWEHELTAWSSDQTRVRAPLFSYRLTRQPVNEDDATVQARRWWRAQRRHPVSDTVRWAAPVLEGS